MIGGKGVLVAPQGVFPPEAPKEIPVATVVVVCVKQLVPDEPVDPVPVEPEPDELPVPTT